MTKSFTFFKFCVFAKNVDAHGEMLEPWFEENSNLYLFTAESFSKSKARIGERPAMLETPLIESLDIDTPDEWDMGVNITNYLLATGKIEN